MMFDTCVVCGCDDFHACDMGDGSPCWWVEADLCSACARDIADRCEAVAEAHDPSARDGFVHGEGI